MVNCTAAVIPTEVQKIKRQQECFNRAVAHMRAGNPELAAGVCKEGLNEFPEDANILCLAARALIALKRLDEAEAHIDKAIKLHSKFPVAHEALADLMLVKGQIDDAIKSYEHAIHLDPGRSDILQKVDHARKMAIQVQPRSRKRRRNMPFADEIARASQFERNGQGDKAENIYRDILQRDPDHVGAIRLLAAIASTHRKFKDAETLLQQAVSLAPDFPRLWLDLSVAQLEQEKTEESVESAKRLCRYGCALSRVASGRCGE